MDSRRFVSVMDCNDSVENVGVRDIGETGVGDHDFERFLCRVHFDRFNQIAVCVGIAGNGLADRRPQRLKGAVGGCDDWILRLENSSTSRRPPGRSTRYISANAFLVRHVAQAKADRDAIERGVSEWQCCGVGLAKFTFVMPRSSKRSRPTSIIAPLMSARITCPVGPTSGE